MLPRLLLLVCVVVVSAPALAQDATPPVSASSLDGKLLAISKDQAVTMIDAQTQKELLSLRGHTAAVTAIAFAPDGKLLATGGKDKAILVWDIGAGRLLRKFAVAAPVDQVRFSPDGTRLSTRETDKTRREFEVATGKELKIEKQ